MSPGQSITLAVDGMGGDHGLSVTVPAVADLLKQYPAVAVLFVALPTAQSALQAAGLLEHPRLEWVQASEVVGMDDPVSVALRNKKNSTLRVAINLVKEGRAQAAVSAGNTGALMAVSRFVLKTLPGIERPAICTALPTRKGHCHMLDLGANVDSEPEHLLQFALMGHALVQVLDGVEAPRIGLLNIGSEDIKGSELIKETAPLLQQASALNYTGFVEGNQIFSGDVDVVVCDGFVGNVALKTMEGVAAMFSDTIREEAGRSWFKTLCAALALPVLTNVRKRLNPSNYNGASLVGLNGIVVKSHGSADVHSFGNALAVAVREAERNVPVLIGKLLADMLPSSSKMSEEK